MKISKKADASVSKPPQSPGYGITKTNGTGSTESVTPLVEPSRVVIGLPAYNEEVGIGSVTLTCQRYADEVIVVDDGSTDRTATVAKEAGATVIEHDTNRGKGAAVRTLLAHMEGMDADVFVMLDSDGQHSPDEVPQVIEPILTGDADLIIGSRYLAPGDSETPLYRRFGQRVLDYLTLGRQVGELTDTQSGFRALSRTAVERLELTTDQMGIETEMTNRALREGLDVQEVPISVRYDGIDGQTHNPLRHGLIVVNFVLSLVRDRHPLMFFGVPGLLLVFFGALYGTQAIWIYTSTGNFYPAKVLVSGFVTILGTLSLFMGLTLHTMTRKLNQLRQVVQSLNE
jgi:glycosyltransferase involved in cell wall biosynthesis